VDGAFAAQGRAEELEHRRCGGVHEADDGTSDADENVHWASNGEGDAFGALQGKGFGNQLSEKNLEVSDEAEGEDDCDGVGVKDCVRRQGGEYAASEGEDDLRDGRLSDPAEGEAGDGDAELDCGKELVDGVLELKGGAGAGTAEGDQLLNAGLADADQGELGSHEEAAGQDKEGHHDHAEEHPFEHSS